MGKEIRNKNKTESHKIKLLHIPKLHDEKL